jgi:putative ABC transport system ATP-binding protein
MRIGVWAYAGTAAVPRKGATLQTKAAAIWTSAFRHPYIPRIMNDISGYPSAGDTVELRGVDLSLGRGAARVHVLRDINLNIGRGEAVGLLGPSGSGKSTLLMVMTGLERPDKGAVVVAGADLQRLDEDALARFRGKTIGIVFQAFHLIPTMTALENVAVPLELAGERDALARAGRELAAVGLAERVHHYPAELSGGEQQRVALARALAPNPAILIADEPTGNLDETTGRDIIEILFRGHRERGTTLVLVTHDTALAARCDRVVHMRSGQIETAPQAARTR